MMPKQIQKMQVNYKKKKTQAPCQLTQIYTWSFWRRGLELNEQEGKFLDLVYRWTGIGSGHRLNVATLYSHSGMAANNNGERKTST